MDSSDLDSWNPINNTRKGRAIRSNGKGWIWWKLFVKWRYMEDSVLLYARCVFSIHTIWISLDYGSFVLFPKKKKIGNLNWVFLSKGHRQSRRLTVVVRFLCECVDYREIKLSGMSRHDCTPRNLVFISWRHSRFRRDAFVRRLIRFTNKRIDFRTQREKHLND